MRFLKHYCGSRLSISPFLPDPNVKAKDGYLVRWLLLLGLLLHDAKIINNK